MRSIGILGSTGSIGTQTLEVVRTNGDLRVACLAAGSNVDRLEEQIREFRPEFAVLYDEKAAEELRRRVSDLDVRIGSGMEGLIQAAVWPSAEIIVTAVVGMIGIEPTIAAIEAGKDIALANKETLVCAGHLIMPLARKKQVRILPVDSEHAAIFQCLQGERMNPVHKILLTASGGPFRGRTLDQMRDIRPEDALKHPNWSMGKKITIDSATMVNKGLEVMEAHWLFDVDMDQVEVVVQPQSIIHSAVEYEDGAVIAQLGTPDMKLPIQYALYYPERRFLPGKRLDFMTMGRIDVEAPDRVNFPALDLAYRAGRTGGTMPTIFNAANERAVAMFLNREIPFLRIAELIRGAMDRHSVIPDPDVQQILAARREAEAWIDSGEWRA